MQKTLIATFTMLALTLGASTATATPFSFVVNVNTAAFNPGSGPWWLDFLLIDGGVGSESNTVIVSDFVFTGVGAGSVPGTVNAVGGATGTLSSAVELTDSDFFNDFYQQFVPGSALSFLVTTNANFTGPTPDQFSFSILQGSSPLNIPTTDFIGNNVLLFLDITGTGLSLGDVQAFQGTSPVVSVSLSTPATPVPEPTTFALLGAGLACLWNARRKLTKRVTAKGPEGDNSWRQTVRSMTPGTGPRLLAIGLMAIGLMGWNAPRAEASLMKLDFKTAADGLLVSDTHTGFEWLTPFYTRGHTFNDAFVQGIITGDGFRYATGTEILAMINDNFGNPPTVHPGTPAGLASATALFSMFGINENTSCSTVGPCPRTQGLSSDVGSSPNTHLGFGMIQFGTGGYAIVNNAWSDSFSDSQMGSWLVRSTSVSAVPEPATLTLVGLGVAGIAAHRARRRTQSRP